MMILRIFFILIFAVCLLTSSVCGEIITDLLYYWKMDEASGDIIDAHADNDGTANGDPTYEQTGIIGTAITFDGTGDYFIAEGSTVVATGPISISMWIYKTTSASARALHFNHSDSGIMIGVDGDAGNYIHVITGNGGAFGGSGGERQRAAANDNTWYHVVGVVNNGLVVAGYLNGVAMADDAGGSWGEGTDNSKIYVGARTDGDSEFTGSLDEIGFWEKELSEAEAIALYNSGSGLAYPFSGEEAIGQMIIIN